MKSKWFSEYGGYETSGYKQIHAREEYLIKDGPTIPRKSVAYEARVIRNLLRQMPLCPSGEPLDAYTGYRKTLKKILLQLNTR